MSASRRATEMAKAFERWQPEAYWSALSGPPRTLTADEMPPGLFTGTTSADWMPPPTPIDRSPPEALQETQ